MIVKDRKIPIMLLKHEALLRRLPQNHPKRTEIESNLAKRKAGYAGEQSIHYYLTSLDEHQFFIFHNLRLPSQGYYFQIDTLLLTSHFALLLEIKNIAGTLYFDNLNQLIRLKDGKEDGFQNPLSQVHRQHQQWNQWLTAHQFPLIPTETLIVISNPSTIIKSSNDQTDAFQKLCHAIDLEERIRFFQKRYNREILSLKEQKKINRLLLKEHASPNPDILSLYDINQSDILTGVQCPSCSFIPLKRFHGIWKCPSCMHETKDAHHQAVEDYFLLCHSTMTSRQFRDFTHISSKQQATRLLIPYEQQAFGIKKGRHYHSHLLE